jgi:hypothetical protein
VDPACGSGSFLINAYQYLLDWYLREYAQAPEQYKRQCVKTGEHNGAAVYKLSINERKRILTGHIYGVDIDTQAVEVTKLSLLLKALEGLNEQEIQKELFNERVLPDLSRNIKCGNSLIGTEFYAQGILDLTDDDQYRINAFDWKSEFADVFKDGGFDAVIGNPPYGAMFLNAEKKYLENYKCFEYQVNSYVLFMEKSFSILKTNGFLSFIVPATFLAQHYFNKIRYNILTKYIQEIILLNYKVFVEADTGDTSIFSITNTQKENYSFKYTVLQSPDAFKEKIHFVSLEKQECLSNERLEIKPGNSDAIIKRMMDTTRLLKSISVCIMGIKPYQKGKGEPKQTEKTVKNRIFDSPIQIDETYKPYLMGKDIDRYFIDTSNVKYIKYGKWLAEPRMTAPFKKKKIILRQTSDIIRAVIDDGCYYNLNNIYNIEITDTNYSYEYLLGVLNSKLMIYVYQAIVPERGKVFAEIKKVNLDRLPIPILDLSKKTDRAAHDKLVSLVDQMLALKKKEQVETVPQTKTMIGRQIQALDKQIDTLVYELYGLTEEEIKVVEGKDE